MQEIFPKSSQVTALISNLFEQYMLLFDEPEKAIDSDSKAEDNKVDSLKQIIDDAHKRWLLINQRARLYQKIKVLHFRGEHSTSQSSSSTESPNEEEHSDPKIDHVSSFEGENTNVNDDDTISELEEEVNAEIDPSYDPNYPPLIKWTKDHPQSQIIGESLEKVLTRSQMKAKQAALFSQVEFCLFNSFVSKVEPKSVNTSLEHSDWVQAMQDELNKFERNKVWHLIPTPKDASVVGLKGEAQAGINSFL
ncbi:hypothetical protein Lser_V15G10022 [Lactuca serriola]